MANIDELLRSADHARQAGQHGRAAELLRRAIAEVPDNPKALNALGMAMLSAEPGEAETLFARAAEADPGAPALWINLATARRALGDDAGEREALERALAIDQRDIVANLRLAELFERVGDGDAAAFRWNGVASVVGSIPDRSADLDVLLNRALAKAAEFGAALARDVDAMLADVRQGVSPAALRRMDTCVDAMLGRRRVYVNEPHGLHFPFLPADEFFPRALFPWFDALEAATPQIRGELEALLSEPDSGFAPYVSMMPGTPANRWTALDNSPSWSARYLWRYGVRDDALCARCPATAAALDAAPMADLPGRAPTAFFSILQPGTRLPPHTGVSNVRAIVHLPLIVPAGCGFRVGGETRAWREGEVFAFDDTIEHEAWNDSDQLRAVLILDVWNPYITAEEQGMLRTLFEKLGPRMATLGGNID